MVLLVIEEVFRVPDWGLTVNCEGIVVLKELKYWF